MIYFDKQHNMHSSKDGLKDEDIIFTCDNEIWLDFCKHPNKYIWINEEFVLNPDWETIEHNRIMELKMTPLDFLKAINKLGVTYETVKQIMDSNPEVDMEMRFCQNVYRKHPMIEQFATQFGITTEQLDIIFKLANGEEE